MAKKALLMILDGWGIGKHGNGDVINNTPTPYLDYLTAVSAHSQLQASGEDVGLPDGQMGNSEVGHLNIGAGRIVYQDLVKINRACKDGSIAQNPQIVEAYMVIGGIPYYWNYIKKGQSIAQNIDSLFFKESGELRDEFDMLYASLFKNPEGYIKIVTALGEKKAGMSRNEIIAATKLTDNGTLTRMLNELEWCGFIRSYKSYGKKTKDTIYQLIDHYTLFYFRFIKNQDINDEAFWTNTIGQPVHTTWCGLAFERVCLCHIPQIKAKLGISGVLTNYCAWRTEADDELGICGAQIDLLLDRKDNIINICEMKYSKSKYALDADEIERMQHRVDAFQKTTKTNKSINLTLITSNGVTEGSNTNSIHSMITMEQLFLP